MTTYTFVIDPSCEEFHVTASTEKEARKQVWDSLTDDQKNACACLECVDEQAA